MAVRPHVHGVLPESGDLKPSFAEAAKYYGAGVDVCPSRRGWRKGVVEKANHSAAQRWWRTLPDEVTPAQAQARQDVAAPGTGTLAAGSGTGSGRPSGS